MICATVISLIILANILLGRPIIIFLLPTKIRTQYILVLSRLGACTKINSFKFKFQVLIKEKVHILRLDKDTHKILPNEIKFGVKTCKICPSN